MKGEKVHWFFFKTKQYDDDDSCWMSCKVFSSFHRWTEHSLKCSIFVSNLHIIYSYAFHVAIINWVELNGIEYLVRGCDGLNESEKKWWFDAFL